MANNKGNFVDVSGVIQSLNKVFEEQERIVKEVSTAVSGLATNYGKLPSNLNASVKTYNDLLKSQEVSTEKLNNAVKQKNQLTQQEITNQRILAQNANRQVLATSQLAGAYRNLSAQVAIASEKVQNIIARGRLATQTQSQYNRELKQAQIEFRKLQDRVLQADKAVDKWNRTNERTIGLGRDLLGAFGVVGGVTAFALITQDVFKQTKEIQSLNNALQLVTGTQENFYKQQVFLLDISERYGVELNSLTRQFTQFYVSAKDKLASNEIQKIFESITKAGASMGLSVESQQRAFLALNQMMSKGTIQAEELRGQLGEALPGAFGIMAKAVGVTEQELAKMMKAGKLLASEVLPKFAEQLEKTYGIENLNRIENLTGAQNRLTNAWRNFVASLDEDGNKLSKFFTSILNVSTKIIQGIDVMFSSDKSKRIKELQSIQDYAYKTEKETLKDLDESRKQNAITEREYVRERINNIRSEIESLKSRNSELDKVKLNKTDPFANRSEMQKNALDYRKARKEIEENNKSIYALNNQLSLNIGNRRALDEALTENTKNNKLETESIKSNNKAQSESNKLKEEDAEIMENTEVWYEKQIASLKEARSQVADTEEEYKSFTAQILILEYALKQLRGELTSFETEGEGLKLNIFGDDPAKMFEDWKKGKKGLEELDNELKNFFQNTLNQTLSSLGFDSLIPLFDGTFDKLWDKASTFNEKFAIGMKYIGDVAMQTFAFINQSQQAQYDAQYQRLEQEKEIALQFAGDSASAREEVERQYENKRRSIQRKQAESQKQMAIFNIAMSTAQGIAAAVAASPLTGGMPWTAIVASIGALQLGLVASRPIPQFAKGTDNAPEGWAYTQEKGREIITDRSGKIKSLGSDGGAKLTYLNSGDKVYTNEETEGFYNSLNNQLIGNGVAPIIVNNSSDALLGKKIDKLAKIISSKESIIIQDDANGRNYYKRKQGEKTKILNARVNIKGYDV